ncbi:HAMP domain-containing sensor histidine kinase [Natrialba sp. INN-245]|uniref:sensor histidine kinase n=1 Tax=Natrialba sp. INN-245 TaxID=2690967 RepID=UPI001313973E|nr:HAMP domain-containing sensor histidine kinase [Natrialba sp. INN-245]MWV41599.1 GHKL domain-containing protein [Natrialba sp. INN-245]
MPAISNPGNRRVLLEWVRAQDEYEAVSGGQDRLRDAEYDICVLDERTLRQNVTVVRDRRRAETGALPVLLVSSASDFPSVEAWAHHTMDQNLWEFVDEVVTTPIEHVELRSRLENLRRIRDQSIAVAQKTEQLLLLNRITRHDIRNEMNVIIGWAGQLEDHVDEAGQEICERVLDSSHNVVDLTRAVREFVEILEMDDDPELKPIPLENALADEIVKRRSLFEDAEFVVDGEIPPVQIQANELLSSVFRNLLNNSVQHNNSRTPRVTVTVTRRTASVVVTIADNGPGIPSDRRDAVLGRTEDGLDHPSAGVGLYLVDTLVEQYGGNVRITDSNDGGAAVVVTLPTDSQVGDR